MGLDQVSFIERFPYSEYSLYGVEISVLVDLIASYLIFTRRTVLYSEVPLYIQNSRIILSLKLTLFLHAEYQECPSKDGPPTMEWVVTDKAEGNQLGTEQRVMEKKALLGISTIHN